MIRRNSITSEYQARSSKLYFHALLVVIIVVVGLLCVTGSSYATSVSSATGYVNSSGGAYMRKSASTSSSKVKLLKDNCKITINKVVFTSKTKSSSTYKWYYITYSSKTGYIRSDLVDGIKYTSVSGYTTDALNYRAGAGTSMTLKGTFANGATVNVMLLAKAYGSSDSWYMIKIGSKYYYSSAKYIKLGNTASQSSAIAKMTDAEFKSYLEKQGFTGTYVTKLTSLHKSYPNWVFIGQKTGLDFSTVVSTEYSGNKSLTNKTGDGWRYKNSSGNYVLVEGSTWYKASKAAIQYVLDPRNFLDSDNIYMFEDLSYQPDYQTSAVVSKVLSPSKLPGCGFTASLFVSAGATYKVSPVFLASRARQETGGGSDCINGSKYNDTVVYNPFNIGAGTSSNPVQNALKYAYNEGWTTKAMAVNGGAKILANSYINAGQNSSYLQKFNVANGSSNVGTHQYMTNIMAPINEASLTKSSYTTYGITDESLAFIIPIYNNMPSSTSKPS